MDTSLKSNYKIYLDYSAKTVAMGKRKLIIIFCIDSSSNMLIYKDRVIQKQYPTNSLLLALRINSTLKSSTMLMNFYWLLWNFCNNKWDWIFRNWQSLPTPPSQFIRNILNNISQLSTDYSQGNSKLSLPAHLVNIVLSPFFHFYKSC